MIMLDLVFITLLTVGVLVMFLIFTGIIKSVEQGSEEQAIAFVMKFYKVSREDALLYYWDEVKAYMSLSSKLNGVKE